MVSCAAGVASFDARIVRMISGDPQPGGPGMKEEPLRTSVDGRYPGRTQAIHPGAHIVIEGGSALDALTALTIQMLVFPTTPGKARQGLLTSMSATGRGFGLFLDGDAGMVLELGSRSGTTVRFASNRKLLSREWQFVAATLDLASRRIVLRHEVLTAHGFSDQRFEVEHVAPDGLDLVSGRPVILGGAEVHDPSIGTYVANGYNGRMERPAIARMALPDRATEALRTGPVQEQHLADVIALWDFSIGIGGTKVADITANHLDGTCVNLPVRAVRGSRWTGQYVDWRTAPEQYAAIHFHDDSVGDCAWQADFSLTIPADLRSGCYAAKLTAGEADDYLPFFVRPPRGKAMSKLLFLVPTATYLAYANWRFNFESRGAEILLNHVGRMCAEERYMIEHPDVGHSTYDLHTDGSPVFLSSWRRPVLNFRPKHTWMECYTADLHLVDWLNAKGIAFDVATDDNLHAEGLGLLQRYACVITGTHPEYTSTRMWDAIYAYQRCGGRFMYMGGNGFYWRVAWSVDEPWVLEMRRGEDGQRSWNTGSGEYHLSFNGEPGGKWHRHGRTPNTLVGNGFVSQGFDFSSYYVRKAGSFDSRAAFIFEGIGPDERIGDFGLQGGGAAGWEIDSFDLGSGTPPHALLLASSEGHTPTYTRGGQDEHGVPDPTADDLNNPDVRSDLVFYETPKGGAVFATGSIAWCASLCHNRYDNNVSRLTENVLRRFLDPRPFDPPPWPSL
jgi:N,N-dimethylformamidase